MFDMKRETIVALVAAGAFIFGLNSLCRADFDETCVDGIAQGAIDGASECVTEGPEVMAGCAAAGAVIGGVDAGCLNDNSSTSPSDSTSSNSATDGASQGESAAGSDSASNEGGTDGDSGSGD